MTGDILTAFYSKQLLSAPALKDYGFEYINGLHEDMLSRLYTQAALFQSVGLSAGVGVFSLDTDPVKAIDDAGHLLSLAGAGRTSNIPFENSAPFAGFNYYYLALRYNRIASGVETAVRTGQPAYPQYKDELGELVTPSSAVANGSGVRLFVNGLCGPGDVHSLAGRTVTVCLETPESATEAVAYETLTVQWDGVDNYVDSAGTFGQSDVTDETKYRVFMPGVSVSKNVNFTEGTYVLLGAVYLDEWGFVYTSTAGQRVADLNLSDLGGIARRDAHDDLKIRVTADASDVSEPQIEVWDSSNVARFWMTEKQFFLRATGTSAHGAASTFEMRDSSNVERFRIKETGDVIMGDPDALEGAESSYPGHLFIYARDDFPLLRMNIRSSGAGTMGTPIHVTKGLIYTLFSVSYDGRLTLGNGGASSSQVRLSTISNAQLEMDDTSGNTYLTLSAAGQISSGIGFSGSSPSHSWRLKTYTATAVSFYLERLAGQTADLTRWATEGAVTLLSVNTSGQLVSALSTGTAPFQVNSQTKVTNLNADLLDGNDWASPAEIGSTTPARARFSELKVYANQTSFDYYRVPAPAHGSLRKTSGTHFFGSAGSGTVGSWSVCGATAQLVTENTASSRLDFLSPGRYLITFNYSFYVDGAAKIGFSLTPNEGSGNQAFAECNVTAASVRHTLMAHAFIDVEYDAIGGDLDPSYVTPFIYCDTGSRTITFTSAQISVMKVSQAATF